MGVTASLQSSTVAVTPGSAATVEIRVRNAGSVVDTLHVEVVGEAAGWATATPPSVTLFPGQDQLVTVTFTPPMAADGPAGDVPFGVRVRSQEDPSGSVVEEGVLQVAAFLAISAELQPRTSRGRKGAVHELAIDNRGTRPVSVTVAGLEQEGNLLFSIDPPALEVPANSATFVKVRLRAAHPFRKGTSLTRMFQVVVTDATAGAAVPEQPLAVAAGMFVQEQTVPRWVRRAVLWGLLGLLALLAFWFVLGKPVVESAAKEAAKEESTPPTIAASSGSAGGGGGPKSGSGSGAAADENTDAGGASVSTGTAAGAGATTTIDGRLFLTEAGVTAYEVPAGATLQVTDIVLQNPSGDAGSLQIRRNGTPLLVVELGNFRDLDYHFVAPIVFTAGQKLELSAACTAGACTPGAYFAGYLVQGG
jgi:hypothetical protein